MRTLVGFETRAVMARPARAIPAVTGDFWQGSTRPASRGAGAVALDEPPVRHPHATPGRTRRQGPASGRSPALRSPGPGISMCYLREVRWRRCTLAERITTTVFTAQSRHFGVETAPGLAVSFFGRGLRQPPAAQPRHSRSNGTAAATIGPAGSPGRPSSAPATASQFEVVTEQLPGLFPRRSSGGAEAHRFSSAASRWRRPCRSATLRAGAPEATVSSLWLSPSEEVMRRER